MKKKGIVKCVEMLSKKNWSKKSGGQGGHRRNWWSRHKGYNGEILYTSETYTTKAACRKTAIPTAEQLGVEFEEL